MLVNRVLLHLGFNVPLFYAAAAAITSAIENGVPTPTLGATSFDDPPSTTTDFSFPTGNIDPDATLIPNPPTDPAASQLIRHLQDRVLLDYDRYTALFCFHEGRALNCGKSWLFPHTWNKASLENHIVENTNVKPTYACSQDRAYLTETRRFFYGFTAENVTHELSGIAHMTAMYAAGSCLISPTCAELYNNDTDQMYLDYRHYVNSTFLEHLETELGQDPNISYCPASINSIASVFEWLTTTFDGGREYFGFHNALFLPGVLDALDPEEQMTRVQAKAYLANNARKVEGAFLNMVFFNRDRNSRTRRDEFDEDADLEELYPGCTRREWIANGKCDGVIPPRTFDMDGSVVPMADRDRAETLAELSHPLSNTGLAPRQSSCDRTESLNRQLLAFETAIGVYNAISIAVAAAHFADTALLANALLVESAPLIATLGLLYFAGAMAVNYCNTYNACNGMPDSVVRVVAALTSTARDGKLGNIKLHPGPLVNALKPLARYSGLLRSAIALEILNVAQDYYKKALSCCETNCEGAICRQTSLGCILSYSSAANLDCAAN